MTASPVPWNWSATTGGWVYAVEVAYLTAAGERATARWCGPPSRCGSGLAAAIGSVVPQQWEARLRGARYSRDLGGLRQHVQVASTLALRVDLAGPADPLFAALRDGRWTDREVVAWFFDRDTGAWVEMERGRVRRGRELTVDGARLSITAGPLLLSEPWPMTRIPDPASGGLAAGSPWTHGDVPTVGAHIWHPTVPGTDKLDGYRHLGRYVGPVWGNGNTVLTGDRVWREVVFYGTSDDPSSASRHYYFHVSPQFGCYVHELYWLDTGPDPSVIRGVTDDTGPGSWVESFNLRAATMGPLGTNCRLHAPAALVPDFSTPETEARVFARISGPVHYTLPPTGLDPDESSGAVERLSVSGSLQFLDGDVIDDVFVLLGQPQALAPGAVADFGIAAEYGPEAGYDYRRLVCAVPRLIVDKPPSLREVLGDLMRVVGADLVQRVATTGAVAGTQRLFPRRRRPSPHHPEADWKIRPGQLVEPDPGDWSISDDAEADYATRVLVVSPEFGRDPADTDGDAVLDVLDPVDRVRRLHDDTVEQALAGSVIAADDEENRYWLPFPGGEVDGFEWQGATRSQPQPWVTARLGAPHFAVDLADTVGYEVAGLPSAIGQVRQIEQDWDGLHVEIRSVHVRFHEGAPPPGRS